MPGLKQPARAAVSVVDSIAGGLKLSSLAIKMRVGESVQIGTDVTVSRAGRDISRQCEVASTVPEVVEYLPESHSLLGVAHRRVDGQFRGRGQDRHCPRGRLVRPAAGRGPVVDRAGRHDVGAGPGPAAAGFRHRTRRPPDGRHRAGVAYQRGSGDRQILGGHACAVAPGEATVTASLAGGKGSATAHVTVNHEEITALSVEPGRLDLGVGDRSLLHIRAPPRAVRTSCSRRATCTSACPPPRAGRRSALTRSVPRAVARSMAFPPFGRAKRTSPSSGATSWSSKCRSRWAASGPVCGSNRRWPQSAPAMCWPIR